MAAIYIRVTRRRDSARDGELPLQTRGIFQHEMEFSIRVDYQGVGDRDSFMVQTLKHAWCRVVYPTFVDVTNTCFTITRQFSGVSRGVFWLPGNPPPQQLRPTLDTPCTVNSCRSNQDGYFHNECSHLLHTHTHARTHAHI